MTLRFDGREYRNADGQGWFVEALVDIQRKLPPGVRLRARVSCAWSGYSPAGSDFTAGPACFRDAEDRYRQVDGKHGPTGILAL